MSEQCEYNDWTWTTRPNKRQELTCLITAFLLSNHINQQFMLTRFFRIADDTHPHYCSQSLELGMPMYTYQGELIYKLQVHAEGLAISMWGEIKFLQISPDYPFILEQLVFFWLQAGAHGGCGRMAGWGPFPSKGRRRSYALKGQHCPEVHESMKLLMHGIFLEEGGLPYCQWSFNSWIRTCLYPRHNWLVFSTIHQVSAWGNADMRSSRFMIVCRCSLWDTLWC